MKSLKEAIDIVKALRTSKGVAKGIRGQDLKISWNPKDWVMSNNDIRFEGNVVRVELRSFDYDDSNWVSLLHEVEIEFPKTSFTLKSGSSWSGDILHLRSGVVTRSKDYVDIEIEIEVGKYPPEEVLKKFQKENKVKNIV